MTNGFGAYIGTKLSSKIIESYFLFPNGETNWSGAWTLFTLYCLAVAILFGIMFKHDHKPVELDQIKH